MYHDAHMAEVMHLHADKRLARAIGPLKPARSIFQQRLRMSSFLNRWLEYLAEQGHSVGTLEPLTADSANAPALNADPSSRPAGARPAEAQPRAGANDPASADTLRERR